MRPWPPVVMRGDHVCVCGDQELARGLSLLICLRLLVLRPARAKAIDG
jgi:hypothetical protein